MMFVRTFYIVICHHEPISPIIFGSEEAVEQFCEVIVTTTIPFCKFGGDVTSHLALPFVFNLLVHFLHVIDQFLNFAFPVYLHDIVILGKIFNAEVSQFHFDTLKNEVHHTFHNILHSFTVIVCVSHSGLWNIIGNRERSFRHTCQQFIRGAIISIFVFSDEKSFVNISLINGSSKHRLKLG